MRVQCSLCDKMSRLDENTLMAKKLLNRPIHTYLCDECRDRISHKVKQRTKTKAGK